MYVRKPSMKYDVSGVVLGEMISPSAVGGEYLGWTGFPGFQAQAQEITTGHLRWPGGINAEDRIDSQGYAYDLSTPTIVDNWDTWNGNPKAGLSETMGFAIENGLSFSMIIPTARYVEAAKSDKNAALDWIRSDLEVFTTRLANGAFGELPQITLEVGAEYYSTDIWEETSGSKESLDLFAEIFANVVLELSKAEQAHGEMYDIAVQSGRFQSRDDPEEGPRNGEARDSLVFIEAYNALGVGQEIDSVVWHRYTERFDQIDDGFRQPIHPENVMSTLLADHMSLWESRLGGELGLVMSWLSPDVDSSGSDTNSAFDHGPRSSHNILQMFSEVAAAGADVATVYGMDIQWPGSLSFGTPSDPEIFYGGAVYGMVAESVVGLSATDTYRDNWISVTEENQLIDEDHANFFVFESDERAVIFGAAAQLESDKFEVEIEFDRFNDLGIARLTSLRPLGEGAFATAKESIVSPINFSEDSFVFEFKEDFEVVRIELFSDVPPPTLDSIVDTYHLRDGSITQVIGTPYDIADPLTDMLDTLPDELFF